MSIRTEKHVKYIIDGQDAETLRDVCEMARVHLAQCAHYNGDDFTRRARAFMQCIFDEDRTEDS